MTAVEWLQYEINCCKEKNGIIELTQGLFDSLLEQAKEMEKQQMIKSILMWDIRTTLKEEDKGSMSEIEEFVAETYGSKGSDETKVVEFDHIKKEVTSSQTEISEHRFTEKDIRFAYMQGYNRGVDGNPNHMESYIEQLKKK